MPFKPVVNHPFAQDHVQDWEAIFQRYHDIDKHTVEIDGVRVDTRQVGTNQIISDMYNLAKGEVILTAIIWETIYEDKWMWCPAWGEQRTGKTTIQLWGGYKSYFTHTKTPEQIWRLVLDSVVSSLPDLLYKLEHKKPLTIQTNNKLHDRVPFIIYDDFGAGSNKAETRSKEEWNIFKGGFDVLGTRLAILSGSMVNPCEPTSQLVSKYTHEIFLPYRGVYKFDKMVWRQNYHGMDPFFNKVWLETETFDLVPMWVYKEYDDIRSGRVDEVLTRMKDASLDDVDHIIKRMNPRDYELLRIIKEKGPIVASTFYTSKDKQTYFDALRNCRSRDLIVSMIRPGTDFSRAWDLTDLGMAVLTKHERTTKEPKDTGLDSSAAQDMLDMV